jgi:hypothetical protein
MNARITLVLENKALKWKRKARAASLCLLALAAVTMGATPGQRPITDFTSRQGAYCLKFDVDGNIDCATSSYGGGGCDLFIPPQPNVGGWTDPKGLFFALVDYAGLSDTLVGGTFGTTLDGSVTEVPLADGRARVSVTLHTRNALAWASDFSGGFPGTTVFGYRLDEVIAGAKPSLGESLLKMTFKNPAPGASLPDVIQLNFCPAPGQELEVYSFHARADGTLRAAFGVPEGTPGRLEVVQSGLIGVAGVANPNSRVAFDAYPAEKITIQRTGK